MSIYGVHKLCRAALHDAATRAALKSDPAATLAARVLDAEHRLYPATLATYLRSHG